MIAIWKPATAAALRNYASTHASQARRDFNNALKDIMNNEFQNNHDAGYNAALAKYVALTGLTRDQITNNAENPNNAPIAIRAKVQCIADDYKAINDNYFAAARELNALMRSLFKP